jgi:hypothetical protein
MFNPLICCYTLLQALLEEKQKNKRVALWASPEGGCKANAKGGTGLIEKQKTSSPPLRIA